MCRCMFLGYWLTMGWMLSRIRVQFVLQYRSDKIMVCSLEMKPYYYHFLYFLLIVSEYGMSTLRPTVRVNKCGENLAWRSFIKYPVHCCVSLWDITWNHIHCFRHAWYVKEWCEHIFWEEEAPVFWQRWCIMYWYSWVISPVGDRHPCLREEYSYHYDYITTNTFRAASL